MPRKSRKQSSDAPPRRSSVAAPSHLHEEEPPRQQQPLPRDIVPPPTEGEGFINPYNFVRVAPVAPPLGRQSRTHEKFAGLSGRITCEFETLTPLCAPDAEASHEFMFRPGGREEDRRRRKLFTRLADGTLYVLGSSVKGMLRSVAEAASNSCFSILTKYFGVFRDNRPYALEDRGVGKMVVGGGALRLDDPCPGADPSPRMFRRRGLFNQVRRPHNRSTRNKARGLYINDSTKRLYVSMIDDENFTLKQVRQSGRDDRRPNNREKGWLLDFENQRREGDLW